MKLYSVNIVSYSIDIAPYLAFKCLQSLGPEFSQKYSLDSKALIKDFYGDDCLSQSDYLSTAIHTQKEPNAILNSGDFKFRSDTLTMPNFCSQLAVPTVLSILYGRQKVTIQVQGRYI